MHLRTVLARVPVVLLALLLLSVTVVAVVSPRNSWFAFDQGVVLAALALGVLALAAARRWGLPGAGCGRRRPWRTTVLGAVVVTILTGLYTVSAMIPIGWDPSAVTRSAQTMVDGGEPTAGFVDYFARYPNNVPLLALQVLSGRVGEVMGLSVGDATVAVQVFMVGVIAVALGWVAIALEVPRRILAVQGVLLVLIGLTPHIGVPYTDVPGATAVALACGAGAQVVRECRRQRWRSAVLWSLGVGVAVGLGLLFKPYVIALPLAAAVVLACVRFPSIRAVGAAVGTLALAGLVALGTMSGLGWVAGQVTGYSEARLEQVREPFPPELWLASGTVDNEDPSPTRRYGGYSQELVDLAASAPDPDDARLLLREVIHENLTGRSLGENVSFFARKIAWTWGDGTFWASGEGRDSAKESRHGPSGGVLQAASSWTIASGEHYPLKAAATQGAWLTLLLGLGVALLRARPPVPLVWWATSLLALTGYLMLFESRPRYLLAMLPALLCLAIAVPGGVRSASGDRHRSLGR